VNRRNNKKHLASEPIRERIMGAGFGAFLEHGYASASTLEIATRARVSKRELYAHFKNKEALFEAGIADRTARIRFALEIPDVKDQVELAQTLESFGVAMLTNLTEDNVLSVYRLAIAESARAPQIAKALDREGRGALRRAITVFMATCLERGLLKGAEADSMCGEFSSLLMSDIMLRMLLGVRKKPNAQEISRRARATTQAFLVLHGVGSCEHDKSETDVTSP
jgi:AcrR family transcriptional regulator